MKYRAPLVGGLVALLLSVGCWFLLYKPAMEEQAALEAETAQLESRQAELRTEIAFLEGIRDEEERHRAIAALLREYVPDGVTQAEAVRQFQRAADAAGVEITSTTFTPPVEVAGAPAPIEPNTTLASIGITMVVDGGYFQTVDFFRRVEVDVPRAVLTQSANLAESERLFPTLATTWSGQLFAVVPGGTTVAPAEAGATPGDGTQTDAASADVGAGEGDQP